MSPPDRDTRGLLPASTVAFLASFDLTGYRQAADGLLEESRLEMGKPRACDVCSLRKIRCSGDCPCAPCVKAQFDCSFAKTPSKPGPKGPRSTTSNRIRKKLHDIRSQSAVNTAENSPHLETNSRPTTSSSRPSPDGERPFVPPQSPYTLSSAWPPAASGPSPITFYEVSAYLKIYQHQMYAVWPVVDVRELLARLGGTTENSEACALAYSVCAATGAQLRLADFEHAYSQHGFSIVDRFATEAERYRAMLDCSENATIAYILIPFFLHNYYAIKQQRFRSTVLLRESLTLCELLDLDKEASYVTLAPEDQRYRRKVFWLLFVTERGNAMQNDLATVLRTSINLPKAEDDEEPILFMGFLNLVRLFVAVEGTLVGAGSNCNDRVFSTEIFAALQQQIQDNPAQSSNETQRTDICVTQDWMRMLLWQLAMKKVSMSAGSSEDPLSLTFPAHVAKDSLAFLSRVSLDSIVAHGPGMELKIFEISNTLLDVINCVPSLTHAKPALMTQSPRDVFHGLSCLLASLGGGQSKSLTLLQAKMAAANVPFQHIPRLVELKDDLVRSPVSLESSFGNSPTKRSYELETEKLVPTSTLVPFQPLHKGSNRFVSSVWQSGTALSQSVRPGFSNNAGYAALDTAQFQDHGLPWSLGMVQV